MSHTMSPKMSRDTDDPRVRVMLIALVIACGVITVLTAAAFWLSYAHLAGVAGGHGLGGSTASVQARKWAWPATLDLFIIAGEVLMFVDALKGRNGRRLTGPVFLTVAGSAGSIGLNVSGVGAHAPFLDYVVAGVPPTAALLAFGALMHQVHTFIVSLSPEPTAGDSRRRGHVPAPAPAVSRPKVSVPAAMSPARPAVRIRLDKTAEEVRAERDMSRDSEPVQQVHVPGAKAGVPEDKLGNLSAIVRFLTETGHTKEEIRSIVPTLPGQETVKPDSLKKAVQRYGPKN